MFKTIRAIDKCIIHNLSLGSAGIEPKGMAQIQNTPSPKTTLERRHINLSRPVQTGNKLFHLIRELNALSKFMVGESFPVTKIE